MSQDLNHCKNPRAIISPMDSPSEMVFSVEAPIVRPAPSLGMNHPRERFILPRLHQTVTQSILKCRNLLPAHSKVLDVGCGRQPYRKFLETADFQYFSFDVSQNEDTTVEFLGPIDGTLPPSLIQAGPFDLVILTEVLEHVSNLETCFSNLNILLSQGGKVIITCPFFFPLHEKPYDFWRISPFALEQFCKKFNFRILDYQQLGSVVDCWGLLNGHLITRMNYQAPANLLERIKFSVQQRFIRWVLRINEKIIRSGILKSYFETDQDFYVSNYLLAEKKLSSKTV